MKRTTSARHSGGQCARRLGGAALAALLLALGGGAGASDSCREWELEQREWKTEALRRYLRAAPPSDVEQALFEMLQREAYLTSCDIPIHVGRDDLIAWRLVGRLPEDYGSAVAESVLDRAGFDLGLRSLFAPGPEPIAAAPRRAARPRGVRPR